MERPSTATGRTTKSTQQPTPRPLPRNRLTVSDVFDDKSIPNLEKIRSHLKNEGRLHEKCVMKILFMAQKILQKEDTVLHITSPVTICGDIHGQFYDLLRLFEIGGPVGHSDKQQYLFLGDYVDRGMFGIECVLLLCSLKIAFPKRIFLLRGNHECRHLTDYFTFKKECVVKYTEGVYNQVMEMFDCLPLAAIVNKQFFCVHGGLSPRVKTIEDVRRINRFQEPNRKGDAMADLLWSDPIKDFDKDETDEHFTHNDARKISFYYTYKAVCDFLETNKLLSIIRGHEAKDMGYQMHRSSSRSKFPSLITIFSAPNYCDNYKNKAVILCYDEKKQLNMKTFTHSYHPYWLPNFMNGLSWSLPFAGKMITNILYTIIQVCTEEELSKMDSRDSDIHNKEMLLDKVKAVGKMQKYYDQMAESNDLAIKLKGLSEGSSKTLSEAEENALSNDGQLGFKLAKKLDSDNEQMPSKKRKGRRKGKSFSPSIPDTDM